MHKNSPSTSITHPPPSPSPPPPSPPPFRQLGPPNMQGADHRVSQQQYGFQPHFQMGQRSMAAQYRNEQLVHDTGDSQSVVHHNQIMGQHPMPVSPTQHPLAFSTIQNNPHYETHQLHQFSPPLSNVANDTESQYSMSSSSNGVPSPATSQPSTASSLRFEVYMEAPTAHAQRADETPLTYLNKGQFYAVNLRDNDSYDGDVTSIFRIMFHDDQHRKIARNYWKFWLGQQANPKLARAFDIDTDKSGAAGIKNIDLKSFDRVIFQWNGRKGSKIFIRFNCLSTDFSRIKGVKGIPLRAHMESRVGGQSEHVERSYCRIKLFRDKGAERKNKDDQKHLERQLEKMRGKSGEAHPLWLMYAQAHSVSVFSEISASNNTATDDEGCANLSDSLASVDSDPEADSPVSLASSAYTSQEKRVRKYGQVDSADLQAPLDVDPTYEPQPRKKKAVDQPSYWAVYLQQLTIADLGTKLLDKLNLRHATIGSVVRLNKKGLRIIVDDSLIAAMEDEQEMDVEYQFRDDSVLDIYLRY